MQLAWHNRGTGHSAVGRYPEALADLSESIRLRPDFALSYRFRGLVRLSLDDLDAAIADYQRALELEPGAPWAASARDELAGALERQRARAGGGLEGR